jgi:hypothetical protein
MRGKDIKRFLGRMSTQLSWSQSNVKDTWNDDLTLGKMGPTNVAPVRREKGARLALLQRSDIPSRPSNFAREHLIDGRKGPSMHVVRE